MKILKRITLAFVMVVACTYLFTGCAYHKYELVGIVAEGDTKITLLKDIEDETIKNHLWNNYQNNVTIDLNQNGTFEMVWGLSEYGMTVTYSQVGTFSLDEKAKTIDFIIQTGEEKTQKIAQQYLNGAIVYFDGVVFLAFK